MHALPMVHMPGSQPMHRACDNPIIQTRAEMKSPPVCMQSSRQCPARTVVGELHCVLGHHAKLRSTCELHCCHRTLMEYSNKMFKVLQALLMAEIQMMPQTLIAHLALCCEGDPHIPKTNCFKHCLCWHKLRARAHNSILRS